MNIGTHYDAIFVVRSPFQLLCAYEAKEKFKIKNYLLVAIYRHKTNMVNSDHQINTILSEQKWSNIYRIDADLKTKYFSFIKLLRSIKKSTFQYVFLGDWGTIHKAIHCNTKNAKTYLLDDGNATLRTQKEAVLGYKSINQFNHKVKLWRFTIFGLKMQSQKKISFFSCIIEKPIGDEEIIVHKFEYLKRFYQLLNIKSNQKGYRCYFLDTPIVHVGLVEHSAWKKIINYISTISDICYVPHRSQSTDISELKSINILNNDMPIEIYFLINNIDPVQIIGTTTTALSTIRTIFPNTECISIDIRPYILRRGDEINDLYQQFLKKGIKVTPLK